MKTKYEIIDRTGSNRSFEVRFTEKNKRGESLMMYVNKCEDPGPDHSLPRLWHKYGFIDRILPNYWYIEVFVFNDKGECYNGYNPQQTLHYSGGRYILNFEWMFEATVENMEKIIDEVYSRFITA